MFAALNLSNLELSTRECWFSCGILFCRIGCRTEISILLTPEIYTVEQKKIAQSQA